MPEQVRQTRQMSSFDDGEARAVEERVLASVTAEDVAVTIQPEDRGVADTAVAVGEAVGSTEASLQGGGA